MERFFAPRYLTECKQADLRKIFRLKQLYLSLKADHQSPEDTSHISVLRNTMQYFCGNPTMKR